MSTSQHMAIAMVEAVPCHPGYDGRIRAPRRVRPACAAGLSFGGWLLRSSGEAFGQRRAQCDALNCCLPQSSWSPGVAQRIIRRRRGCPSVFSSRGGSVRSHGAGPITITASGRTTTAMPATTRAPRRLTDTAIGSAHTKAAPATPTILTGPRGTRPATAPGTAAADTAVAGIRAAGTTAAGTTAAGTTDHPARGPSRCRFNALLSSWSPLAVPRWRALPPPGAS